MAETSTGIAGRDTGRQAPGTGKEEKFGQHLRRAQTRFQDKGPGADTGGRGALFGTPENNQGRAWLSCSLSPPPTGADCHELF